MMTATLLMAASPAWATNFTVNTLSDDKGDESPGDGSCFTGRLVPGGGIALVRECTLRAAIQEANFNEQPDMVNFASWLPSGTIHLIHGQLTIANDAIGSDLTIEGLTGGGLRVSGNDTHRVVEIASGSEVTIKRLTIAGGDAGITRFGGGILNDGTLALTNSTVSGNFAVSAGCGIFNSSSSELRLTNVTVSGNTSVTSEGGGIFDFGTAILANTVVASNAATTNPDASGTFTSQGNNLIGNTSGSGSTNWALSDLLNCDPLLGPLQNNGGPTSTLALLPGSPAIDHAAKYGSEGLGGQPARPESYPPGGQAAEGVDL
jgi:CSLREA domain-containing protein